MDYSEFESHRDELSLSDIKVTYFPNHSTMIVKLPGVLHDTACSMAWGLINAKFSADFNSRMLKPTGSRRRIMVNGISKEPYASWVPTQTRGNVGNPSFVVEVGESESMNRVDARIWLDTSGGSTRLVLLVSIDKANKVISFERWEMQENTPATNTRSGQVRGRAACTQRVTANYANGNVVSNAPLILPIERIFDNPVPLPRRNSLLLIDGTFTVTATDIQYLAQELFAPLL